MKHLCWFLAAVVLLGSPAAQAGEAELQAAARAYYRAAGAQFEAKHCLEAQAGFAAGYELFWTGAGAGVAATVVAVSVRGSASTGPAAPSGNFTVDWRAQ